MSMLLYYIQHGWNGNLAVWWCPEGKGYTVFLDEAGVYSKAEVAERRWRKNDIARLKSEVDAKVTKQPIIVGHSDLPAEPAWVEHEST